MDSIEEGTNAKDTVIPAAHLKAENLERALQHVKGFFLTKEDQFELDEKLNGGTHRTNDNEYDSSSTSPLLLMLRHFQRQPRQSQRVIKSDFGCPKVQNQIRNQLTRRLSQYNMPDGSVKPVFFHNKQASSVASHHNSSGRLHESFGPSQSKPASVTSHSQSVHFSRPTSHYKSRVQAHKQAAPQKRVSLEMRTPELCIEETAKVGEYISKNGQSFKHQKFSQFQFPKNAPAAQLAHADPCDTEAKKTNAQTQVAELIQRVQNRTAKVAQCDHRGGATEASFKGRLQSVLGNLQVMVGQKELRDKEFESVITHEYSVYQKNQTLSPSKKKSISRQLSAVTPGSPATATLAGQAEATLINRALMKFEQQYEPPQLQITVNNRFVSSVSYDPKARGDIPKMPAGESSEIQLQFASEPTQGRNLKEQLFYTEPNTIHLNQAQPPQSPPASSSSCNQFTRPKSAYQRKLCQKIMVDVRKPNYDLDVMQEEVYGTKGRGHPTDLNVVYDIHKSDADKQFAGIVALLPQAKPQRVRSAKVGAAPRARQNAAKAGVADCRQQPSQRRLSEAQQKFNNLVPITGGQDDERLRLLKDKIQRKIRNTTQYFGVAEDLYDARVSTTDAVLTSDKTTAGEYKRLKKGILDLHENSRKRWAGGKPDTAKLDRETRRYERSSNSKHNLYTQGELQTKILSGRLQQAVTTTASLPTHFERRDFSLNSFYERGSFDYAKLHDIENQLMKDAKEKGLMQTKQQAQPKAVIPDTQKLTTPTGKKLRASSARFQVQKLRKAVVAVDETVKSLSPAQSAKNVACRRQNKRSSIIATRFLAEPPSVATFELQSEPKQTKLFMSRGTTAAKKLSRPTTASRVKTAKRPTTAATKTFGVKGDENLSISGCRLVHNHSSTRMMTSQNSTAGMTQKTKANLQRESTVQF